MHIYHYFFWYNCDMKKLFICIICVLFFIACGQTETQNETPNEPQNEDTSVEYIQITDLHYLSKTLYDDGLAFQKVLENNDAKLFMYSEELLDAIVKKVIEEKPDAFLLSGDLTFNGEEVSLYELEDYLKKVKSAGIPVLVIPGNHDINYRYAGQYIGDKATQVMNVSEDKFKKEMGKFGYEDALYKDESSFSYAYAINDEQWVIALDANTQDNGGSLKTETLSWLDETLKIANEEDVFVTVMTHQNILKQNDILYEGFIIENADILLKILKDHNVTTSLSGHSHIQHSMEEDGFTEYCTESYVVYPLNYARIKIEGDTVDYSLESIGLYQDEAKEIFDDRHRDRVDERLEEYGVPEEYRTEMKEFYLEFTRAAFTDDRAKISELSQNEAYSLWQEYGAGDWWVTYMEYYANQ